LLTVRRPPEADAIDTPAIANRSRRGDERPPEADAIDTPAIANRSRRGDERSTSAQNQ
jgi:hypothetical protein